jgi:NMD protein affecting ribosome stability and mRNA decay
MENTIECYDCGTWLEFEPDNVYGVCEHCLPRRERDEVILPPDHPMFAEEVQRIETK